MLLLLWTTAHCSEAQVPQLFTYPKEQRVIRLYHLVQNWTRDSLSYTAATIDSVRQMADANGDEKLNEYSRLFNAFHFSWENRSRPITQTPLWQEKVRFEQSPFADVRISYAFYLGNLFFLYSDYENAFHYLIPATERLEKIGWDRVLLAMWHASFLFELYYRFGDYATALHFVQLALQYLDTSYTADIFLLNNMGVTYLKLKDLKKAQAVFQQVLQRAKSDNNTDYAGIASGNYGNTLRLQGRYAEARPYLYADLQLNEKKVPENSAITCAYIALCLLHTDSLASVPLYLKKAADLHMDWNWFSFYPPYYEAWALYYKKRGNYPLASLYQDSLLIIKDSLKEHYNTSLLMTTSLTLKEERRMAEQRQKELETAQLRLTRNITVACLVLVFLLVLAVLLRKRKKEKEDFAARQKHSEEKLHKAESDLAGYISMVKKKTN